MAKSLPFPPTEFGPASLSATLGRLLGQEFTDETTTYRLLELDNGADADIRKKALVWVSRSAFTVKLCTAKTDRVAGVGPATMNTATTPDGSYILVQTKGRATVTHGDDHAAAPLGGTNMFALPDDDADTGKVLGTAAPTGEQCPFGRYVSGTAADNADIVVELDIKDETQDVAAGAIATADLADDAVTTDKIDDDAVTTAKIDDDAVTADKVADGAIDAAAKLASGVVETAKIAAGNVTPAKLVGTLMTAGHFVGRNGAGACTLTGALVGDRVLVGWLSSESATDTTVGGENTALTRAAFVALFETAITVADQIQQASATDLSGNKYTVILLPAAA